MSSLSIFPSLLKKECSLVVPPSKSHTIRALLFSSLATGSSTIANYLRSDDTLAMIKILKNNGCVIQEQARELKISGKPSLWTLPYRRIDAQNSGQIFRFCTAQAARSLFPITITGDSSVRNNRPILPLLKALSQLGCAVTHLSDNNTVPFSIYGPIKPGNVSLEGRDSQLVSSLLMVLPFLKGDSTVTVVCPGEIPWIDLTLYWLQKIGARIDHHNYETYTIRGHLAYSGFHTTIPSDFSSLLFPVVLSLISNIAIEIRHVDFDDVQGDKKVLDIFISLGGKIEKLEKERILKVFPSLNTLKGRTIDVNPVIDSIPILAVLGCFAQGKTVLYNGAVARKKESDRLHAITRELLKMKADITETRDGLIIKQSLLQPSKNLFSHNDHRIAMSLVIAALSVLGTSCITNIGCIDKSFPDFIKTISYLGGKINLI